MSKQKSAFVTAIIAVMLAVITFAAYRLSTPMFIILVSILSAVGFASSAIMFCRWLEKDPVKAPEVMEPPVLNPNVFELNGVEYEIPHPANYEEIKAETESWEAEL